MQPIPTWWLALVVVRSAGRYLLVRERKFGQTWYLPAGRVDPGEDVRAAARRETLEETGIEVELDGLLAVEHLPAPQGEAARLRFWFTAHPRDPAAQPKSQPDEESLEARWVGVKELADYPLRAPEARQWLELVDLELPRGPMHLLRREGEPFLNGAPAVRPGDAAALPRHGVAGPQL